MLTAAAKHIGQDDVLVVSSGVTGEDLHLSPKAREIFPFCFEVKCTEKLNLHKAIKQAESHCEGTPHSPIVVFTKNRDKVRCIVEFELMVTLLVDYYDHKLRPEALPEPS